jgi:hypothetical protein
MSVNTTTLERQKDRVALLPDPVTIASVGEGRRKECDRCSRSSNVRY